MSSIESRRTLMELIVMSGLGVVALLAISIGEATRNFR
jgi:hypothetical protein